MTRTAVIVTLVLAACDVGTIYKVGPDGGAGGDGSSGVCEMISASPPQGHHNPGQACIAAGCHLEGGGGGPAYTYAGTLYKDTAGTMPYPGATIFVKLGGVEKKTITADNGNFWFVGGAAGLDAPSAAMQGETRASGCPTVSTPMVGKLVQGGGNCNNCHRNGGTTLPVYLNP